MPETVEIPDFGRFRIVRLLGAGGMGQVYLAIDRELRRQVALKILTAPALGDADAVRRMVHEARAAAAVAHPGICAIHDTGTLPDGRPYIVMQYVDGESLQAKIAGGPLRVRTAFRLAKEIAEALAAVHAVGIVHRDLKPSNVIVTPDGHTRLVDFGIACLPTAATRPEEDTATGPPHLGDLVGTAGYMSPEQLRAEPLDGRSDLFSLGAVLFECVTGRRAFSGANWIELNAQVLHREPPPLSSLIAEATTQHDAVCARLLAKEPLDRFQSALEAGAAMDVLSSPSRPDRRWRPAGWSWARSFTTAVGALLLFGVLAAAAWRYAPPSSPVAPSAAEAWLRRGTDQIRDGAYESATRALSKAVELFPQYVLAHARLAEAYAELDDWSAAKDSLLRVSALVPDESRLPREERLRIGAVRALVTRDIDTAVARYRDLVSEHPRDANAWVDLGRVQEDAGLRNEARVSFGRAVQLDPQSAAGHLRLGALQALESEPVEALGSFDRAESLYNAASDTEGVGEVRLARAVLYDGSGEVVRARTEIERARAVAVQVGATSLALRSRLLLSVITASEGKLKESEALASGAVDEAVAQGLENVAASGLIDLAATLLEAGKHRDALSQAERAVGLASRRNAARTAAAARIQLASIQQSAGHPQEALDALAEPLAFVRTNKYRRLELTALSVSSRAHQALDHLEQARDLAAGALDLAESIKDDAQIAVAASSLAGAEAALGSLPRAEELRARAEKIHRRQQYQGYLPYDLANHAEVLIRLNRLEEARRDLDELAAGIDRAIESYLGRARRMSYLRALSDVIEGRCVEALSLLRDLTSSVVDDSSGQMAPSLAAYCSARLGVSQPAGSAASRISDPVLAREDAYWRAVTALAGRDWIRALAEAKRGLEILSRRGDDEARWRLSAVAASAGAAAGDEVAAHKFAQTAGASLQRVSVTWGETAVSYLNRSDLRDLAARGESQFAVADLRGRRAGGGQTFKP